MNINKFIEQYPQHPTTRVVNNTQNIGYVYLICENNGEIVYIGSTVNAAIRFQQHSRKKELKGKQFFFFTCPQETRKKIEAELIYKIKPKYNTKCIYSYGVIKKQGNHLINPGSLKIIRNLIKQVITEKGISLCRLQYLTNIHRQTISNLLSEDRAIQVCSIPKLQKICSVLRIDNKKLMKL